jgi:hypothetical protein
MDPLQMDMVMQESLIKPPIGLCQSPLAYILYSTLKLAQWWTIDGE